MERTRDMPSEMLYDKRIVDRNLKKNLVTQKELEIRLKDLTDLGDRAAAIEISLEALSRGAGPRAVTSAEEELESD